MGRSVTQALIEQASLLWEGGLSTRKIGLRLGVSKNSVVGWAARNRHLFPPRPSPIASGAERSTRPVAAVVRRPTHLQGAAAMARAQAANAPQPAPASTPPAPPPAPPATVFRERRPGCCRWPMWGDRERPTHVYCEAPTVPGTWPEGYCPRHQAIARQNREPKEAAA